MALPFSVLPPYIAVVYDSNSSFSALLFPRCDGSKSAAVALERALDLDWSSVVLVVVVVVSSSRSPLWTSSSSRPRLRRRSPVLNWTVAFRLGRRAKATRFVVNLHKRRTHALCPPDVVVASPWPSSSSSSSSSSCPRGRRRRRRLSHFLVSSLRSTDRWDGITVSLLVQATAPFISRILSTFVVVVVGVLVVVVVVSARSARHHRGRTHLYS